MIRFSQQDLFRHMSQNVVTGESGRLARVDVRLSLSYDANDDEESSVVDEVLAMLKVFCAQDGCSGKDQDPAPSDAAEASEPDPEPTA